MRNPLLIPLFMSGHSSGCALPAVIGDTLWMFHARSRFKFVEVLLDVVIQLLRRRKALVAIVGAAVVLQCVYLAMWARLLDAILSTSDGGDGDIVIIVLLFLSLRWTCGLIKHVVTVTISGTFAALLQLSSKPVETSFTYDVDEDLGLEFSCEDLPSGGYPPGFTGGKPCVPLCTWLGCFLGMDGVVSQVPPAVSLAWLESARWLVCVVPVPRAHSPPSSPPPLDHNPTAGFM